MASSLLNHSPPAPTHTPDRGPGAEAPVLLAAAQRVAVHSAGHAAEAAELAEALRRRAAASAGLVRAAEAVALPEGAVLLVSLWESVAAVRAFAHATSADVRAWRRRTKLVPLSERALWWVRQTTVPDTAQARERLAHLRAHTPSTRAFTLRSSVPPPR